MGFWRTIAAAFSGEPVQFSSEDSDQIPMLRAFAALNGPGLDGPISRDLALQVPAVQSGRNLICGVSTLPLVQYNAFMQGVDSAFLSQIERNRPNLVVLAETVEDLMMEKYAYWRVTERMYDGYPYKAERIAPHRISVTEESGRKVMRVDGRVVRHEDIIKFESPNYALLQTGGKPIRRALLVEMTMAMYAGNPRALDYFTEAEDTAFDSTEAIDEALAGWREARRTNSTGFVPKTLKYETVDTPQGLYDALLKMAEAATIDIANMLNLDSEDFNISTTSRTYFNADQKRKDRINDVLSPFMTAITARLSMGDVTKRGYVVEFDTSKWLDPDPVTRIAYYEGMRRLNAITPEEIRIKERLAPMVQPVTDDRTPIHAEIVDEQRAIAASADDAEWKFGDEGTPVTFDAGVDQTFSVDVESRTITGIVVPYGPKAISSLKSGRRFRFAQGSIRYTDVSRIKLLIEHDRAQAVGKATAWTETPDGIKATFKVADGPEGDRALALAAQGVRDGLSPGVDEMEFGADPLNRGVQLVRSALAKEVSLVAIPSFDDSRLTSVRASYEGGNMPCNRCGLVHAEGVTDCTPTTGPAVQPPTGLNLSAEQFTAWLESQKPQNGPEVIDPTGGGNGSVQVNEALPYSFSNGGGAVSFRYGPNGYDFSTDIFRGMNGDGEARNRVDAFLEAAFDTDRADVASLIPNPTVGYVDQMDYSYPLWDLVNKGGLPNGGQPFIIPKFNTSSALVNTAVEGVEPAPGAFTTTSQTITPTQVWGKAEVTRQTVRAGGNPAVSGLIWNQMLREYREDREAAVATFLATLTAATDIALPAGTGTNQAAVGKALEAAIASLNFVRGGNRFRGFAVHQDLYEDLAAAETDDGAPMYPILNPSNRNGEAVSLFRYMNIAGVTAVGSWALGAGGATTSQNSWLFNPETVHGWADAPFRLDWNFGATVQGSNIPQLSHVTIGIYGDIAFGNTDIAGVRQVTYDPTAV